MKPLLLDLYCCEGGASTGYARAGFDVHGVDLFEDHNQKRYPFPSYRSDALEFLRRHGHKYAAYAASPPCWDASAGTRSVRAHGTKTYPRLIGPTRDLLLDLGKPYILENVRGAVLHDPIELCGCMFDLTATDEDGTALRLERPRLFESNVPISAPRPHNHSGDEWVAGVYGGSRKAKRRPGETLAEVAPRDRHEARYVRHGGYVPRSARVQADLLGIDWMTQKGRQQAIPPVYTEHLGRQLMAHLRGAVAVAEHTDLWGEEWSA